MRVNRESDSINGHPASCLSRLFDGVQHFLGLQPIAKARPRLLSRSNTACEKASEIGKDSFSRRASLVGRHQILPQSFGNRQKPSIAVALSAPKLADHPVRLASINCSSQHALVT